MEIEKIRRARRRKIYFTLHALEKMVQRNIKREEVREALQNGEIIEEYSQDKYGPSCLIFGWTKLHRALHVVVSYTDPLLVITSYEPSLNEWINYKIRKEK